MALFKKDAQKNKKEKTAKSSSIRRARAVKPAEGTAHELIHAPWFSEKAFLVTEKGVYTFAVSPRTTKAAIAGAIKEIYNVEPRKVRIVNLPAKRKMMRTRRGIGVRSAHSKAYVYLKAGDTIQFT